MSNLRLVLTIALPSFTALLGFLYYLGRKRDQGKSGKEENEDATSDNITNNHAINVNNHKGQGDGPDTILRSRQCQNTSNQISQNRERDKFSVCSKNNLALIKEESESQQSLNKAGDRHLLENTEDLPISHETKHTSASLELAPEVANQDARLPDVQNVLSNDPLKSVSMCPKDDSSSAFEEPTVLTQCTLSSSSVPPNSSTKQTKDYTLTSKKSVASPNICSQESDGAINHDISVLLTNVEDECTPFETNFVSSVEPPQDKASTSPVLDSSHNSSSIKPNESVINTSVSNTTDFTSWVSELDNDNGDTLSKVRLNENDMHPSLTENSSCNGTPDQVSLSPVSQDNQLSPDMANHDQKSKMGSVPGAAETSRILVKVGDENGSAAVAVTSESPGCDSNSEASNDSGRGGSVTEPLPLPIIPLDTIRYEFNFPSDLCGRLIGKNGRNINLVKEKSGANITLKNNPCTPSYQICVIEGRSQMEVDKALVQIRRKFPPGQFPQVDFTPLSQVVQEAPVLMPDIMQLNLPDGVSVDVVVSNIVDAGHIFVQQPTHPTFPSLERLNHFMMACYTQDRMVPPLPRPIEVGVICAAFMDGWFRAQVVSVSDNSDEVHVKYVDYGGYARVQSSMLKQIRSDFMTLPFQAVECYMGNITHLHDELYFSEQASSVLEELTQGKLLQAQVVARAEDGIPCIHIYQISGDRVLFINREMVNRKVVGWLEIL